MMKAATFLVAAGLSPWLGSATEAERCKDQLGYKADEYLVGYAAWQYIQEHHSETVVAIPAWNETQPVAILKDCPIKVWTRFGDTVHTMVVKEQQLSYFSLNWEFERQDRRRYEHPYFALAWEAHMPLYNSLGGINTIWRDAASYVPWLPEGTATWYNDDWQGTHDEQRRDLYHQAPRDPASPRSTYYQPQEHWGPENGKMRLALLTRYSAQVLPGWSSEDMWYRGTVRMTEHVDNGIMRQDQYDILKLFFQTYCAPYRGGALYNQPFNGDFDWFEYTGWSGTTPNTVTRDFDNIEYCGWIQHGWNDTYWSQHLQTQGGTCHMIDWINCDNNGYVSVMHMSYEGLRGDFAQVMGNSVWASGLVEFWALYNSFTGTVPQSIQGSGKIQVFNIFHNKLRGNIPCFGAQATAVTLSYNQFDQPLPDCVLTADRTSLDFSFNFISGQVPAKISQLTHIGSLWLQYNQMRGSVPSQLCDLHTATSIHLEGNKLDGQLPSACLNNPAGSGLENIRYFFFDHNRLTGTVPMISANRGLSHWCTGFQHQPGDPYFYYYYWSGWRKPPGCTIGSFNFDHNDFHGTIGDQWKDVMENAANKYDGRIFISMKGNRLSGPLPSKLEDWSFLEGKGTIGYDLSDNFFRCEPDETWPDWTRRKWFSGTESSSWDYEALGKCLPIAHPMGVSPTSWTVGQAGTLVVTGEDFVERGTQVCRFIPVSGGQPLDSSSTREGDQLVRCLVPIDIAEGQYDVTISNFEDPLTEWDDFCNKAKLTRLGSLPRVTIVKPIVPANSNAVEVEMQLDLQDIQGFNAGSYRQSIAEILGVPVSAIQILETTGRRLQSGTRTIKFVVKTDEVPGGITIDQVNSALGNNEQVKATLNANGVGVNSVNTDAGYGAVEVLPDTQTTENEGIPIVMIIIIVVAAVLMCSLCGFIFFLYRREKAGQAYFKETLDDEPPATTGTVIGNTAESNEV